MMFVRISDYQLIITSIPDVMLRFHGPMYIIKG